MTREKRPLALRKNTSLPELPPRGFGTLVWFDLNHGIPIAWGVLRSRYGWAKTLRIFGAVAWRTLTNDPLKGFKATSFSPQKEKMSRHQFRQAMILDTVLDERFDASPEERKAVMMDIVSTTGEHFIEYNVPLPHRDDWVKADQSARDQFAQQATQRFFNANVTNIQTTPNGLQFDVSACRFAELSKATNKPLAQFFCEADARFCARPNTPTLERNETLAQGHSRCAFRFTWASDKETDNT